MQKLILTLLFTIITFTAQAQMAQMNLPAQCGPSEVVNEYVEKFEFIIESMSMAKEGANPNAPIAYYVYTFVNKERTQKLIVLTSPSGQESCIVSHSFDLQLVPREGA
tara:strand:+ start:5074 stop:5397 length:324 start_codon:yes stop_codon:yes gene_type:complete